MNPRTFLRPVLLGILLTVMLAIPTGPRGISAWIAPKPLPQAAMPVDGWQVCWVGGIENIPGVGERQVFELCHAQGWNLRAYCLDPGGTPPALGAACSSVGNDTYWCGDNVQELRLFAVLATPGPTRTPTRTSTRTPTRTPTRAPTLTRTPTVSPRSSLTPMLATIGVETATPRPHPGGPGNAPGVLGGAAGLLALTTLGAAVLWLRRDARG